MQETPCVIWGGSVNKNGYGYLYVDGKQKLAHRVAYETEIGPIPDGLVIDHLCRNRACVNTQHMEPVTIGENVLRGETGPGINSRKTECIYGHSLADAYVAKDGRRACRTCRKDHARRYYQENAEAIKAKARTRYKEKVS